MLNFSDDEITLLETYSTLIGIDEAGRGPWAGPVVMAGVLIDTNSTSINEDLNDSKKLTAKRRDYLFDKIKDSFKHHIEVIDNLVIDEIGIGNAVVKGMNNIIAKLNPAFTLIDGYFKKEYFPENTQFIVKGDQLVYCISAASILAKVTRDRIMEELNIIYPEYNFKKHKGYGTKEHMENLQKYGVCEIHRKSYKPINSFLTSDDLKS